MVLFHNISGVPREGKPGKACTAFADAAGLFCCNETAALFKQAVHGRMLVHNGEAWPALTEVCVTFRLNIMDKSDYKAYKLLTGTTNNHKQQQTQNYGHYNRQTGLSIIYMDNTWGK